MLIYFYLYNRYHNFVYLIYPLKDNFHMCWTQRKDDKLNYLKKTLMWYLSYRATLENLGNSKKNSASQIDREISRFHGKPNPHQTQENWKVYFSI